jgi:hypothetical protein
VAGRGVHRARARLGPARDFVSGRNEVQPCGVRSLV